MMGVFVLVVTLSDTFKLAYIVAVLHHQVAAMLTGHCSHERVPIETNDATVWHTAIARRDVRVVRAC